MSGPATAQGIRPMQEHFGEMTYRLFCAGCHGADGRGDGAVANALEMPIGDLTRISKRNGGVFPRGEIADAIAGRGTRGHTQLRMAPWAEMFADEFEQFASRFIASEMVARRIEHLVAYLESIQEE